MDPPVRLLPVLAVLVAAAAVAVLVIWLRWPVECDQTAIGFEPGQPDPNSHGCRTRIGTTVSIDAARVSAVLWGQAAAAAVLAAGGVAAWTLGWLRPLRGVPPIPLGRAVTILGAALLLGAVVMWLFWPGTCTAALRVPPEGGRPLVCSTRAGIEVARETARMSALLWGQAVAASVLVIAAAIWGRQRLRHVPPANATP